MDLQYKHSIINPLIEPSLALEVKRALNPIFHHLTNLVDAALVLDTDEEFAKWLTDNKKRGLDRREEFQQNLSQYRPVSIWVSTDGTKVSVQYLRRIICDTDLYTPGAGNRLSTKNLVGFNHRLNTIPTVDAHGLKVPDLLGATVESNHTLYDYGLDTVDPNAHIPKSRDEAYTWQVMPFGVIKTAHFADVTHNYQYYNMYRDLVNTILEGEGVAARWEVKFTT